MSIDITSNSGNGAIVPESIFNYSYSEEVTSLSPASLTGGTGQVSINAVAIDDDKIGTSHPKTGLMVNNTIQLTDSEHGSVEFQVKNISLMNGVTTIIGDTIMSRLNVIKPAGPIGGAPETPATLLDAINYYCSLVSVTPVYDDLIDEAFALVPVNFIGWTGNVWEYLKMLCAAQSVSLTDDVGFEMYVSNNQLHFRYALVRETDFVGRDSDKSINIDAFDAAKSVGVYYYDTRFAEDGVMYEFSNYDKNADPDTIFKSSINDVMQVDAGESITKRFVMDASLQSINQPVCVSTISRVPPAAYAGLTGEYVVVGDDDLPIQPSEWVALGGKLEVSITENPNEIEVTITAPASFTMPTAANPATEVTNAPYKIGAELGDYPAFWLTGTGVFFNKQEKKFLTGASDSYTAKDEAPVIDNPFISDLHTLSNRGIAAAQEYCGPAVTITRSVADYGNFGDTIGFTERLSSNRFRYDSASYTPSSVQLTGRAYATVNDFDEKWVGKTFADFNAIAFESPSPEALKFNEFTVIPLMESN